jgi:hypothetical protein
VYGRAINHCHNWRDAAWRTSGIATVSVLTRSNTGVGGSINVEIEIVTTGVSIKAHTRAPTTKRVCGITLATKTSIQSGLLEEISRLNGAEIEAFDFESRLQFTKTMVDAAGRESGQSAAPRLKVVADRLR